MADDPFDRPEVDALYALDPAEFVAARNALAKELKAAGEAALAAEVGRLRKPTRVAWAVNRVVRADPDAVAELRAVGAELRTRQVEALAGGDADALRAASAARREAVRALTRQVVDIAGDAHRDEAASTFEAASVDDEAGTALTAGRLSAALHRPADLGLLGLLHAADADRPPAEPIRLDRRRVEKLTRALGAATDARDDASATLDRATAAQATADRDLAAARERLDAADRDLEAARAAHRAAEDAVVRAQQELDAVAAPADAANPP